MKFVLNTPHDSQCTTGRIERHWLQLLNERWIKWRHEDCNETRSNGDLPTRLIPSASLVARKTDRIIATMAFPSDRIDVDRVDIPPIDQVFTKGQRTSISAQLSRKYIDAPKIVNNSNRNPSIVNREPWLFTFQTYMKVQAHSL